MERVFCQVNGKTVEIEFDEECLLAEEARQPCAHFAPFLERLGELLQRMIEREPGRLLRAEHGVVWVLHYENLTEPVYAILNGVSFADVAANRGYVEYHVWDQTFCFFPNDPSPTASMWTE